MDKTSVCSLAPGSIAILGMMQRSQGEALALEAALS